MENKKNIPAVRVEDLGLIVGAAEDAKVLISDLLEDYLLIDPESNRGRYALIDCHSRALALATSIELQLGYVLQELKKLGARR